MKQGQIRVAVVDSGCTRNCSLQTVRAGYSFFSATDPFVPAFHPGALDKIGHGTECIRLISAEAPRATIVPLKVFGDRLETSLEVLCGALRWALNNSFDVLNLSLATDLPAAQADLLSVTKRLTDQGTMIVASASTRSQTAFPAGWDHVLGVSALSADVGPYPVHTGIALKVKKGWPQAEIDARLRPKILGHSHAAALVSGIVAELRETGVTGDWKSILPLIEHRLAVRGALFSASFSHDSADLRAS